MQPQAFWKAVAVDRSNLLERFFDLLQARNVRFCLIEGQALNAYVEPVVSLDLDVVVAAGQVAALEPALADLLHGKVWAVQDSERRPSKRQKDLADIARILEAFPGLRTRVPGDVLTRLV